MWFSSYVLIICKWLQAPDKLLRSLRCTCSEKDEAHTYRDSYDFMMYGFVEMLWKMNILPVVESSFEKKENNDKLMATLSDGWNKVDFKTTLTAEILK